MGVNLLGIETWSRLYIPLEEDVNQSAMAGDVQEHAPDDIMISDRSGMGRLRRLYHRIMFALRALRG